MANAVIEAASSEVLAVREEIKDCKEVANTIAEEGVTVKKIILTEHSFQSASVKAIKEKHERDLGMKQKSYELGSSTMQEDLSIMKLLAEDCGDDLEVAAGKTIMQQPND